jgi:hypothetical protein
MLEVVIPNIRLFTGRPLFLEQRPSLASFTNIYITTTTIIGCAQQQKEQLQKGEEGTGDHLHKLMYPEMGHMESDFGGFSMWVLDYFDKAEGSLLIAGILTFS